jgi:hypothetical protein
MHTVNQGSSGRRKRHGRGRDDLTVHMYVGLPGSFVVAATREANGGARHEAPRRAAGWLHRR